MTEGIEILIHSIKAIEYRFRKAIAGSENNFGHFKINEDTRSPNEIIKHMFDLATKTRTMINDGHFNCPAPENLEFKEECERFLFALEELKVAISNKEPDIGLSKKLLQGPILDIATHIGQIAMLNGLNGNKIPRESYYSADIG
jgi:hypothetical protein